MTKRVFSLFLVLIMIAILFPADSLAAETIPSGYTAISTAEELDLIRFNLSGRYILTADIDLTAALASGGSLYNANGWQAIGYSTGGSAEFTGIIDGNGHTITGFSAKGSDGSAAFIYINKGTIKNLTISGTARPNSSGYNGVFCTQNYGTIQNCHNKVAITSSIATRSSSHVGGLVGYNQENAVVEDCSNQADINVTAGVGANNSSDKSVNAGGIVALNKGTIRRCYNSGDISATSNGKVSPYAGGIVGVVMSNSLIQDTYNTGDITANKSSTTSFYYHSSAGGIFASGSAEIKTSYNAGKVVAKGMYSVSIYGGALAGYCTGTTFTDCYYLTGTAESATYSGNNVSGATELTLNQMRTQVAFSGFNFNTVWEMGSGYNRYPVLKARCTHALDRVSAKAATCTEDGNIEYWYCNICEKYFNNSGKARELSREEVILPSSHSYEAAVVEPSCTASGSITYTCFCGSSYVEELPANGHDYISTVSPPDCTQGGYTSHTCASCGDSYIDSFVGALGHSYCDWYIDISATCTEDGQLRRDCQNCDHYETTVFPQYGHSYESVVTEPTCTEGGYTVYACTICADSYVADYTKPLGHSYDSTIVPPTVDSEGYTVHTCANCGDSYTDSFVPKLVRYGDVNGDGEIDGRDLLKLKRYLANYDDETETSTEEVSSGADVNGDGKVDGRDLLKLKRYLANYDDETGTSTEPLGPKN